MSIARPPETSPKKVIQSVEGLNLDQWQSIDINQFVPETLQQILDAVTTLIDAVESIIELGIEVAKVLAAITSELFDLIKAVVQGLADAIKDLLDLFPLLDTGVYFLWIPTEFGGVDYFTKTFKNSLTDSGDPMRPPQDARTKMKAMMFMWGAPWFNDKKKQQVNEISAAFSRLFSIENKVEESLVVPYPDDFSIEKGQFTKPADTSTDVTNTILVPQKTLENSTTGKIRTTIKSISRKSKVAGISHNIRWRVPDQFGAFSRKSISYSKSFDAKKDNTESYIFRRKETVLIGIDIVRGETLENVKYAKKALQSPGQNPYSFTNIANYADSEAAFVKDTHIIHHTLSSVPGTDYYIDVAPEPEVKTYYYAAAFVYQTTLTEVYVTKQADKSVNVDRVVQTDIANQRTTLPDPDPNALDEVNFENIRAKDVQYKKVDVDSVQTTVGPATSTVAVSATAITSSTGGAPPDWISFSLLQDLLPEIQRFIDKSKNLVDTVVSSILDDADALQGWIETKIKEIENILNEAKELTNLLDGLLFPPLAGVNYLYLDTNNGMQAIIDRYERSLKYGLSSTNGDYNPLLLDKGFQKEYPLEYQKRVHIPAYDANHLVGGFILVFQEPAVKAFFESALAIGQNFTNEFQKLVNDSRLRLNRIKIPELKKISVPTHPFVVLNGYDNPGDYMQDKSDYNSGNDETDDDVNSDGNVEMKSKPGPYINNGPPLNFSVLCDHHGVGVYHSVTIPKGTISATQVVSLLPCGGSVVDDGSFVMEGPQVGVSPCSYEAAELFGLDAGTSKKAPDQNIDLDGEPFEVEDGDFIVTFVNNGRPDLDMRQASVPIFQLNKFNDELLTPLTYNIKIDIEGDEQIIDVTGNAGSNAIDKGPTWFYEATFPLTVESARYVTTSASGDLPLTGLDPEHIYLSGSATGFTITLPDATIMSYGKGYVIFNESSETITIRYNDTTTKGTIAPNTTIQIYVDNNETTNGEWIVLQQANPVDYVGNDQFTFQISGTPVTDNGISDAPVTLTLRPNTYPDIHAVSSEILRLLIDAGYPVGLFSTAANEEKTNATFFITENWAQNSQVALQIVPETRDFVNGLDTSIVSPGTDNDPYLIDDVVANLNAAYTKDYFSNENGSIRITGTLEGPSAKIKVFTSTVNNEYAIVSKALFGFKNLQALDSEVAGIGTKRLSDEYHVEFQNQVHMCVKLFERNEPAPKLEIEFVSKEYEVEIINSREQEYIIEFVKQT